MKEYKLPIGCDVRKQLFWLMVIFLPIRWRWNG